MKIIRFANNIAGDKEETLNLGFISIEHWFLNDVNRENVKNENATIAWTIRRESMVTMASKSKNVYPVEAKCENALCAEIWHL